MGLHKTVYVSHALPDLNDGDLQDILRRSIAHNDASGLTGFLLYGHGLFLQVLEGEATAVADTMQRIRCDPRHSRIQELLSAPRAGLRPARPPRGSRKLGAARRFLESEPIQQREFARWTMGFKDLGRDVLAREPYLPYAGRALTLAELQLRPRYALHLLRSVSAPP